MQSSSPLDNKPTKPAFIPDAKRRFRQALHELKQKTVSLIDHLAELDLNSQNSHQEAFNIIQRLQAKLDRVCREHLRPGTPHKQLSLENLKVEVEVVSDYPRRHIATGSSNLIAFKNLSSYL